MDVVFRLAGLDFKWVSIVAVLDVAPKVSDQGNQTSVVAPLLDVGPLVAEDALVEARLARQHMRQQRNREVTPRQE